MKALDNIIRCLKLSLSLLGSMHVCLQSDWHDVHTPMKVNRSLLTLHGVTCGMRLTV